jgi:hypothetical protein
MPTVWNNLHPQGATDWMGVTNEGKARGVSRADQNEGPLDIKAQQVTIVTVPPPDASICTPDPTCKFQPMTWKLVDGGEVAEKIRREKMNKARKLVYPAARALLPVQN